MHMTEKAPAPRGIDPKLPEELDVLISQLLEKDPRSRPVDAHRIELDLAGLARRLGCAVPPDPGGRGVRRPTSPDKRRAG